MAKIINISDKLNVGKPVIQIGEKTYEVNDTMATVLKFEELATVSTLDNMMAAIKLALGESAAIDLDFDNLSMGNFKVYTIAILAAMQGIEYGEAESRFPK